MTAPQRQRGPARRSRGGLARRPAGLPSYRILFTSLPFLSHLQGQLPLAYALRRAGNEVRFAVPAKLAEVVAGHGFEVVPVDINRPLPRDSELSLRTAPGERPAFAWTPAAARIAPALIREFGRWLPHVVVRDPLDFGSCLAAEHAGVPHVVGREGPFWSRETLRSVVGADLDHFRGQLGLPPDPSAEMPYRFLAFAFAPPGLLPADVYVPPVTHFIRPAPVDTVTGLGEAGWAPPPPGATFVYATIGTVFNTQHEKLLEAIVEALSGEPYQALVTTGPGFDEAASAWSAAAANLTVRDYVPQSAVLPHCDAVVAHGGFLTVIGALRHGVPLVLVPLGGDQSRNARWCAASGAGLVLDETQRDAASIRRGVRRIRSDPGYRDCARRLQAAMSRLPPLSAAVSLVERLARDRVPIRRDAAGPQATAARRAAGTSRR